MMTIGHLSQRTGVKIETIRYYERVGILPAPVRTPSGRRRYDTRDIQRLELLRRARDVGFAMQEVRTLLRLQDEPQAPCRTARELAGALESALEERIQQLSTMRDALARLRQSCPNRMVATCRVLEGVAAGVADGTRH